MLQFIGKFYLIVLLSANQLTLCCFYMESPVTIKLFPAVKANGVSTARSRFKSSIPLSSHNLLRPTWILEKPIPMHCVYNLVFHEILQAAIKDNFDETYICIFQHSFFHLFLTELCCSRESKKKDVGKIASVRRIWILSL